SSLALTGALATGSKNVSKSGGGLAQVVNTRAVGLTVAGGTLSVTAKGSPNSIGGTGFVQSLTIAPGATLDVTNNAVIIDYSGASPLATIQSQITSGYA